MGDMKEEQDCRKKYGFLVSVMKKTAEGATPKRVVWSQKEQVGDERGKSCTAREK